MAFVGTITGIPAVISGLNQAESKLLDAAWAGTQRGALASQSVVRGRARGRPGPRAVTGDFNRSIVGDSERAGSKFLAQVGTNAAQARRLEFGFYGQDVLGRTYAQPPYPYMQPSVPEVTRVFVEEVKTAVGKAFG